MLTPAPTFACNSMGTNLAGGMQLMTFYLLLPLWPIVHVWYFIELYNLAKESRIRNHYGIAAPFVFEAIMAIPFLYSTTGIGTIAVFLPLTIGFKIVAYEIAEKIGKSRQARRAVLTPPL